MKERYLELVTTFVNIPETTAATSMAITVIRIWTLVNLKGLEALTSSWQSRGGITQSFLESVSM